MRSSRMFAAVTLTLLAAIPVLAEPRREVLVLGVYHMNSVGRDIFNPQVDDVLAPKRQAEMEQLIQILKAFRPTKIAVERTSGDTRIRKDYDAYLAGTHPLTRNEIEQIGFRLAKELGHKQVYAVDIDGEFPYARLVKFAKATGRSKEFDAIADQIGAMVKAGDAYLASHTIAEMLLYLNSDEKVAEAVGYYYRQAELSEPWDWAGADLVADWFRRNMRIYANVMQLADSPDERVLVIYGSGHIGWLQQAFAGNPTVRLRKLAEFVK